jgi:hypothetical protein
VEELRKKTKNFSEISLSQIGVLKSVSTECETGVLVSRTRCPFSCIVVDITSYFSIFIVIMITVIMYLVLDSLAGYPVPKFHHVKQLHKTYI